jgi:hypothetical protein
MVLTTYFTRRRDPQPRRPEIDPLRGMHDKNGRVPVRDDLILPWWRSVVKNKLSATIFHDGLPDKFISKYKTKKVLFQRVSLGNRSLNDERFYVYLRFIKEHRDIKKIIMTDLFDVEFFADPFRIIGSSHQLYTCHERPGYNRTWFDKKYRQVYGTRYNRHPVLYNAGVIGGMRKNIVLLLRKMCDDFNVASAGINANMAVYNRCAQGFFSRVMSGRPFTSRFYSYERGGDFCIRHK